MYNEHHAQTLSREMAVQNVKEFASSAISSDGSFQVRTADQLYFWHEWRHETREGRVGGKNGWVSFYNELLVLS